jgi:hypothetical protein
MTSLRQINKILNQAAKPGLVLWEKHQSLRVVLVVTFALMLVAAKGFVFSPGHFNGERADLASLSKSQMMRYARSVQETIAHKPDMLLKLAGEDVRLILAAPDLQRVDQPSVIWQYRTASCVLDVYFTTGKDGSPDAADVAYYEVRSRAGGDAQPEAGACLQGLYQERAEQIAESFRQIYAVYDQDDTRRG